VGGALALLLAAAIVLRAAQLVPWTLLGLGALYAATLAGRALDGWAIAVGAALLLAAAIFLRAAQLVPWTLLGLGALYAATLAGRALDGWAIAVGAALLLAAELAYWAIDDDPRLHVEPELQLRRAASIAAVVAAGLAAGLAVVIAAGVDLGAGLPLTAAGAVAAVGLLLVVVGLATSSSASS
jgi:hypothetical protein